MEKIIPVLTSNYGQTATWLMEKAGEKLDQFRYSQNEMRLKDGTRYIMVQNIPQLLGLEFDEYIVSPQYWDLRMEAEARRNRNMGPVSNKPVNNDNSDNIVKGGFIMP